MRRAILGTWAYFEYSVLLLVFLPIFAIVRLIHRKDPLLRVPGRWMRSFGRLTGSLNPLWKITVAGTPPPDIHHRAYVVVSNHESTADIFVLTKYRWDMRWIAKEELFKTPFVGWALRLCGDIRVRRGAKESVVEMMEECRKTLRLGMPLMLFPEGTRSKDGRLLPFKDGAFQLAVEAQCPILPIALAGTRDCMPKKSLWFGDARAHAELLEPISTEGLTAADIPRIKDLCRARIQEGAEGIRRDLGLFVAPAPMALPVEASELR